MSGRPPYPPYPMAPRDHTDIPRFLREAAAWRTEVDWITESARQSDRVSLAIHLTGLLVLFSGMLWVFLT